MRQSGVSMDVAARKLGHSSIQSQIRYLDQNVGNMEATKALHNSLRSFRYFVFDFEATKYCSNYVSDSNYSL